VHAVAEREARYLSGSAERILLISVDFSAGFLILHQVALEEGTPVRSHRLVLGHPEVVGILDLHIHFRDSFFHETLVGILSVPRLSERVILSVQEHGGNDKVAWGSFGVDPVDVSLGVFVFFVVLKLHGLGVSSFQECGSSDVEPLDSLLTRGSVECGQSTHGVAHNTHRVGPVNIRVNAALVGFSPLETVNLVDSACTASRNSSSVSKYHEALRNKSFDVPVVSNVFDAITATSETVTECDQGERHAFNYFGPKHIGTVVISRSRDRRNYLSIGSADHSADIHLLLDNWVECLHI